MKFQLFKDRRTIFFGLFFIIVIAMIGLYLSYDKKKVTEVQQKLLARELRVVKDIQIKDKTVKVEIANSRHKKANGLMYRSSLGENEGMFFPFGVEGYYHFWMKNTLIPLDIIWADPNLKIVYIQKNVQPCTGDTCEGYVSTTPAKYVVEVKGGWVDRNGIKAGDTITIDKSTQEILSDPEATSL